MKPKQIRAVIFDLGGVLLDWNPRYVYRRFFNSMQEIDDFLTKIGFDDWNLQQDKGRPFSEGVADLSSRFPEYAPLIRAYHEHWAESVAGPIDGTVKIAQALKSEGTPLFALSNWSAETFPLARRKYDCLELFERIVISGDAHLAKPDPRIFEFILREIGLQAPECLLVDDAPRNIAVANELGFETILFRNPALLAERLEQLQILKLNWRTTLPS
jgi:2-haloacid dehalogenase